VLRWPRWPIKQGERSGKRESAVSPLTPEWAGPAVGPVLALAGRWPGAGRSDESGSLSRGSQSLKMGHIPGIPLLETSAQRRGPDGKGRTCSQEQWANHRATALWLKLLAVK
jgi:hypothetical protein